MKGCAFDAAPLYFLGSVFASRLLVRVFKKTANPDFRSETGLLCNFETEAEKRLKARRSYSTVCSGASALS